MLNMLVIEDNVIECQQLINIISSQISDLKLYSMTFNGKDALDILEKDKIDIILLDLILPDISGINIIEYIERKKLSNYENSIVVVSGETYLHPEFSKNTYIYSCFQNPINFNALVQCIENIIKDKNNNINQLIIKDKINNELGKLNYNFSYIGTQYLSECIYEIFTKNLKSFNLSRDIYPLIAKKHSTNVNNIKCNIFQATLNSYYDCEQNKLEQYFKRVFYEKPKTKDVIYTILSYIKN